MRPKVAALILLAGALALAGIWWLRQNVLSGSSYPGPLGAASSNTEPSLVQPRLPTVAEPRGSSPSGRVPDSGPVAESLSQPGSAASSTMAGQAQSDRATVGSLQTADHATNTEHEAYVRSRVVALRDLAMEDDPVSLQTILTELTNADRIIRAAALEATLQFGSRDAIPRLKEVAAATEDPKEKVELLEAAEFLQLPSLTELRAQMRQRKAKQTGVSGDQPQNTPK